MTTPGDADERVLLEAAERLADASPVEVEVAFRHRRGLATSQPQADRSAGGGVPARGAPASEAPLRPAPCGATCA
jgi:hypothetical protein